MVAILFQRMMRGVWERRRYAFKKQAWLLEREQKEAQLAREEECRRRAKLCADKRGPCGAVEAKVIAEALWNRKRDKEAEQAEEVIRRFKLSTLAGRELAISRKAAEAYLRKGNLPRYEKEQIKIAGQLKKLESAASDEKQVSKWKFDLKQEQAAEDLRRARLLLRGAQDEADQEKRDAWFDLKAQNAMKLMREVSNLELKLEQQEIQGMIHMALYDAEGRAQP